MDTIKLNLQGAFVKVYGLAEDEMLTSNNSTALEQKLIIVELKKPLCLASAFCMVTVLLKRLDG